MRPGRSMARREWFTLWDPLQVWQAYRVSYICKNAKCGVSLSLARRRRVAGLCKWHLFAVGLDLHGASSELCWACGIKSRRSRLAAASTIRSSGRRMLHEKTTHEPRGPGRVSQPLTHLAELLVLTLTRGSLYALIAVGFALVFGTGRILNLFHGGFFLLGAYAAFFLSRLPPLPLGGAWRQVLLTLLAAAAVGVFGFAYYWGFLRRYLSRPVHLMVIGLVSNLLV